MIRSHMTVRGQKTAAQVFPCRPDGCLEKLVSHPCIQPLAKSVTTERRELPADETFV